MPQDLTCLVLHVPRADPTVMIKEDEARFVHAEEAFDLVGHARKTLSVCRVSCFHALQDAGRVDGLNVKAAVREAGY